MPSFTLLNLPPNCRLRAPSLSALMPQSNGTRQVELPMPVCTFMVRRFRAIASTLVVVKLSRAYLDLVIGQMRLGLRRTSLSPQGERSTPIISSPDRLSFKKSKIWLWEVWHPGVLDGCEYPGWTARRPSPVKHGKLILYAGTRWTAGWIHDLKPHRKVGRRECQHRRKLDAQAGSGHAAC